MKLIDEPIYWNLLMLFERQHRSIVHSPDNIVTAISQVIAQHLKRLISELNFTLIK